MNSKFKPYNETTVDGFIDAGKMLDFSESTITIKEKINDDLIVPYNTLIGKYYYVLTNYISEMTFEEDDFQKYKYQPRLLSYDLYGTPELAYSLLYINNMPSVMNFNKKKVKIFSDDIMDVINELLSLNEEDITKNLERVGLL